MKGPTKTPMEAAAPTDPAIGQAVHRLRMQRGLSLRTLASSAGFSPSFVSQVENGQTSPSIASLGRLAQALGLGLADFFAELAAEPALVMHRSDRRQLTSEWSRASVAPLVPPTSLRSLEGVVLTLGEGGRSGRHASVQPREQLAVVLEGEIALTIGEEVHLLAAGDAAAIPANCPHTWDNRGASESRLAITTTRPGERAGVLLAPAPTRGDGSETP